MHSFAWAGLLLVERIMEPKSASQIVRMSVLHPRFIREQRDIRICAMRHSGASLQKCAGAFGMSRERVRQIVNTTTGVNKDE